MTDYGTECYRRYLKGDDEGMAELVREYRKGLHLYLQGVTNSFDLAEELTQETFVRLATRKPHFLGNSSFKTWLYSIAHNLAMDEFRRKKHLSMEEIEDLNLTSDEPDSISNLVRQEQQKTTRRAMMSLNVEYRTALYLKFFQDMQNSEISRIMHKTTRQVENLIYRGKAALKQELEREGFRYEDE